LSYSLEWDQGGGGLSYIALTGSPDDDLTLTHTQTGLTTGATYMLRYRVRNTYGWSSYSEVLSAVAATPPHTPT
jgi:hypothetical protein